MCEKHYDCVCLYPRVVLVVRVLIDKKADLDLSDTHWRTPLYIAAQHGLMAFWKL